MCADVAAPAGLAVTSAIGAERLLAELREALAAEALAVVELGAPDGVLAPMVRAIDPEGVELVTPSLERQLEHAGRLAAGELSPQLTGCEAELVRLAVEPRLHASGDAWLLVAYRGKAPDRGVLTEASGALTRILSGERRRRLADILFAAVEQAADPIEVTDRAARLIYANAAWGEAFGYAPRDVTGRTVGSLFRDPNEPLHDRAFYQFTLNTLARGNPWLGVIASRALGGGRVLMEAHVSPFDAPPSEFRGNFAVRRKLDHRADRDRALTVAHHEFRAVLSNLPDGVVVLRDGKIYFANAAFLAMVDRTEGAVIGAEYLDFVHPDDREQFVREHQGKVTRVRVLRHGKPRVAEISTAGSVSFEGSPASILFSRDTTDHYIAQEELARAEKLSALGALAAGVAHEINNPLAYVTLNLQQLIDDTRGKLSTSEIEALEEALEGAERMKTIVSELKGFSGSDAPDAAEPVNVIQAVTSALNIAQNEIRHRARLSREHEPGLFVLAREGQLVQVLVNVLVNAAQAIPAQSERDHVIRVVSRRLPGDRVQIAISDTGEGIPEEILEHVFDPFATGKRRGEGSGLGLTISKRIIDALGGKITVRSARGAGTTVSVDLPSAVAPVQSFPAEPPTERLPALSVRARVLVIDDELSVAKGLKRMLAGHDVVIVRDGEQALELLAADADFDVILCDVMMPALPGSELYYRAIRNRPELTQRFVFMTGGAFTQYGRSFLETVGCTVLHKPFDAAAVLESVQTLARARRRAG